MQKKYFQLLTFILLLIYFIPDSPKAKEDDLKKEEIFQFLHSAFQAQVSLSELDRSMEEIELILEPYFSKEYQQQFLEANLFEENGKYFTYGTDFGEFYIPFFEFSDNTKVVIELKSEQIYIFEYFQKNQQGPIGYDSHYEGLLIKKINGKWKISEYLYNRIPEIIINKALE